MKDGIASLRPVSNSGIEQGPKDAEEQTDQPVLLQNLQSFLADKLQMADRYNLCGGCGSVMYYDPQDSKGHTRAFFAEQHKTAPACLAGCN